MEDDRNWSAKVQVPLGLGSLKLAFDFEKVEEREPEFASLSAKGNGVGAMINMQTSFTLEPSPTAATRMLWAADLSVAGPVGSMGQRVLQPIVKQQVNQVLGALEKQVAAAAGSDGAAAAVAVAPPFRIGVMQLTMEPLAEMLETARRSTAAASTRSGSPRRTRGGASTGWRRARRPPSRR